MNYCLLNDEGDEDMQLDVERGSFVEDLHKLMLVDDG